MSKIQWINEFPIEARYDYRERIAILRACKIALTAEKALAGIADDDDYGLI